MITVARSGDRYTATRTLPLPGDRVLRMTYDVTPLPGVLLLDLGHGVTVVKRDAPRPGGAWVAPYAANCAEHGWIDCRRTVEMTADDGREHIRQAH